MEAQAAAAAAGKDVGDEHKMGDASDEDHKFYDKKDRRRKKKEDAPERPPTPTDGASTF